MKKSKTYLKAFTLIEVIFTVFLTSLIIYGSYEGYLFLNKMFYEKQAEYRQIQDYQLLELTIKRDFFSANKIVLLEDVEGIELTSSTDQTFYFFYDDQIIRSKKGNEITYDFNYLDKKITFENEEVKANELVDRLEINVEDIFKNTWSYSFYKLYGLDQIIDNKNRSVRTQEK